MPLASALPTRLPFSSGSGGTYYVNGSTGDDSRSTAVAQSSATPWRTLNKALSTVPTTGSVIIVQAGTYRTTTGSPYGLQYSRTGSSTDPITLRADTPGTVFLTEPVSNTTSTLGAWIIGATGLRVQDIEIGVRGGNIASSSGVLVQNSHWIEFYRCQFEDTGGMHMNWRGGAGTASTNLWLYACRLGPCGFDATGGYYDTKGGHHCYLGQYQSVATERSGFETGVVANCIFYGTTPGRHLQLGPQARNCRVVNNTFYNNQPANLYAGTGVELFNENGTWTTSGNIIKNNIFHTIKGSSVYGSAGPLSGNIVENNLSFNITGAGAANDGYPAGTTYPTQSGWPSGNTLYSIGPNGNRPNADPLFTNAATLDFSLQAASPAKGVSDIAYTPTDDYNQAARSATAPSLGAVEGTSGGGGSDPPPSDPDPQACFRTSSVAVADPGTTLAVPSTGAQVGDRALVFIVMRGATVTPPSGFAQLGSELLINNNTGTPLNARVRCYEKTVGSSEPATWDFVVGNSNDHVAFAVVLKDVTGSATIAGTTNGTDASTIALSSLTPASAGILVCFAAQSSQTAFTVPGSMVERQDSTTSGATDATAAVVATEMVAAGATGTRTITDSNPNAYALDRMAGYTVFIAQAGAPANTVVPAVSGTPINGQTLTCDSGTWTGTPTSYAYQWQRDTLGNGVFTNVAGATNPTFVLTSADLGDRVRCVVTATNANGSVAASSNQVGPVNPITPGGIPSSERVRGVTEGVDMCEPLSSMFDRE